jgi:transposase
MIAVSDASPDDIEAPKALVLSARTELAAKEAELARVQDANERLWETLRQLRRAQFGRKSEKLDPDQLSLAMEETEQAIAETGAAEESSNATLKASRKKTRSVNRGALPSHLPREEIIIEPESTACPCCGGAMHVMGEDRSERLDVTPAQFKVIVTRRPKYACRACEGAVAALPPQLQVRRIAPIGRPRIAPGVNNVQPAATPCATDEAGEQGAPAAARLRVAGPAVGVAREH